MKQYLKISESVSLPADAVTQTMACIGRKGAGKTYLASVLAEQMLDIGAQVVVIDPVGNWFGLRVGADGKSKGKDIFIAGGERGDVPVLPESGARFARLVVEKNVSLVLDVSSFRQGERKRFAADFAEEFFHLKKSQRSAVHLFVEEAQLFAPQRTGPEEARMLGAFENIIRLGRNYGIGATLITQRPQSVNKEVLSQVECLCVLQVNGSHERKALEEWVQEAGADRKLVGELPGLERGEGYVWSPSWLRVFARVKFSKKTTFDASATPEVGKAARTALLTAVDVQALKEDLKEVITSAEKDDPKTLRRKIAELERAAATSASTAVNPRVEKELDRVTAALQTAHEQLESTTAHAKLLQGYVDALMKIQVAVGALKPIDSNPAPMRPVSGPASQQRVSSVNTLYIHGDLSKQSLARTLPESSKSSNGNGNLRAGARRMLTCLVQWMPSGRTESQLAAQVQMKKTGGTWGTYKSDLKGGGYIEIRDGLWFATEEGRAYVGADAPEMPATTEEVVALWGSKLRSGARKMLDALVAQRGRSMSRESLGSAVEMEPAGGTFGTYLSDLKQAGLILVDRDGIRANRETLLI
jgi:uncharacterized protein